MLKACKALAEIRVLRGGSDGCEKNISVSTLNFSSIEIEIS